MREQCLELEACQEINVCNPKQKGVWGNVHDTGHEQREDARSDNCSVVTATK